MKKTLLTVILATALFSANAQDNPRITTLDLTAPELAHYMAPGWNLGNTMEAGNNATNFTNDAGVSSETSWQSTKTSQAIIDLVKQQGFKSVRIPCSWVMGHITDANNMTIDPAWIARVKEIVDYCINDNMYVVLNDHWDGGWLEHDGFTTGADVAAKKEQLRKLWTNIANAFKDYDERLIFAGLNEPGVGGASPQASGTPLGVSDMTNRLIEYEQVFINAVRATGGNNAKRVLVVQGPKTNATDTYKYFDATKLTDTADKRIMIEFHHYDPYQFTQMTKDEDWGLIYYYWYGHAPRRANNKRVAPQSLATQIHTSFNNLKTKYVDKGYPVIMGEYGSNHRNIGTDGIQSNHDESLQYWYNFSTEYAYEAGIIPFVWDTNNLTRPNMTAIDRGNMKVNDSFIINGIKEGANAGQSAFNAIYPEPSTADGINNVTTTAKSDGTIYNIQGVAVGKDESALAKGIYIRDNEKFVVR